MLRIAYARVSTSKGEQLSALVAQRSRLEAEGPDLLLEDVESGLNTERPQYLQLKHLIASGKVSEVVATRLDRLGRDASESDAFVSLCDHHGVVCRCLDDGVVTMATPEDLLLTRLKGSLSQGESMRIKARVRKGLAAGRELGKPMRKPCWGYRLSADRMNCELDPEQAPHALRFIELLKRMNWRMQPALEAFDGPIPIRSGRGVRAWLLNPTIRGAVAYRQVPNHQFEQILWNRHPALLSQADYTQMEVVIGRNRLLWGRNCRRTQRALTGLCVCGECGYRLKYIAQRTHHSLRCGCETCSRRYKGTREDLLLRFVIEELSQRVAKKLASTVDQSEPPEVAQLKQQIEALERQGDPDLEEAVERKRRRLAALLSQPAVDPELERKIADPRWFDSLSYDELTAIVQQLVERVELTNGVPAAIRLKL
jgi:DNA invertase Pin-like site-specific DNA recombinase